MIDLLLETSLGEQKSGTRLPQPQEAGQEEVSEERQEAH